MHNTPYLRDQQATPPNGETNRPHPLVESLTSGRTASIGQIIREVQYVRELPLHCARQEMEQRRLAVRCSEGLKLRKEGHTEPLSPAHSMVACIHVVA